MTNAHNPFSLQSQEYATSHMTNKTTSSQLTLVILKNLVSFPNPPKKESPTNFGNLSKTCQTNAKSMKVM